MSYRCVDWSVEKANERVKNGKNEKDPYIESFSKGSGGKYINEDTFTTDDKTPCVFRGLGKTHLISAIGHCLFEKNPHLKIVYTSKWTQIRNSRYAI